jgi:hypothetical protein
MANANPYQGRIERKKKRRANGDIEGATALVWRAMKKAETIMKASQEHDVQLKAIHALSQSASVYARLIECGELEARLAAIETAMQGEQP